jgi:hypothetical protein
MPGPTGARLLSTTMSPEPATITKVSVSSCWCGSEWRPGGTRPQFAPTPNASTAPMSISPRSIPNEVCSDPESYVLVITGDPFRGSVAQPGLDHAGDLGGDGRG